MNLLARLAFVVTLVGTSALAVAGPSETTWSNVGSQINGGLPSGASWASWGIGTVRNYNDLVHSFQTLSTSDASCIDVTSAGAPSTPASCANDSPITPGVAGTQAGGACGDCFTRANRQLNGMRLNLERLRCTYSSYSRYVHAKIAFGDSASGIHAVTGLAWQNARAEIVGELENLKHAYDQKYADMMPNLRAALDALGHCEDQFFHEPDWYNRYGFIYYTFMADRYKRSD